MPETFRVFSGWDSRQAEAAEVFAYSVRQNASIDVDVRMLKLIGGLDERVAFQRQGRTQFSYTRFLVPWLCDYEGRALYGDGCDQLCLGDVAELAVLDMQGKPLAVVKHQAEPRLMRGGRARSWSSVMLMDCAKLQVLTPAFVEVVNDGTLMRLSFLKDEEIGELPAEWNALMEQGPGHTWTGIQPKLCHWSHISDPDIGPWIDASGSALWADWRERWRGAVAA